MTVHIEGAHTADTLAAVVVKDDRLLALLDELLVEDVHHLKEGGVGGDVAHLVGLKAALGMSVGLTPNLKFETYICIHCIR